MLLSTKTIGDLKNRIPRQLTGRYHATKWPIDRFNEISSHLEQYCDIDYMTAQMIIPMEDKINRYKLDNKVRQVRGLYLIPSASAVAFPSGTSNGNYLPEVSPDKENTIRFDQFGNFIDIQNIPSVSDPIFTSSRLVLLDTGSTLKKLFDIEAGGSPLDTKTNLRGKGVVVTHSTGAVDHLIIADSDGTEMSLTVNGEMSAIPDLNTVYSIYNDFWVMEYAIYLPRLDVDGALTQTIDVPIDFEEVYRTGLFWHYYTQEGENKVEIDRYQKLFDEQKSRFTSDQVRFRSDNKITIPRSIPSFFPSSRNG